jgi:hypothetical protein
LKELDRYLYHFLIHEVSLLEIDASGIWTRVGYCSIGEYEISFPPCVRLFPITSCTTSCTFSCRFILARSAVKKLSPLLLRHHRMHLTFRLPSRNSPSHISAFDCSRNCLDISKHPEFSEKPTTSRPELLDVIQYLPELEVAVCTTCRVAVCFDEVDRHLYSRYGGCHFSIKRTVAQRLQSFTMPQTLGELRHRPGGVPPLEFLVTPLQGFFCPLCPSYKTTHYPSLRVHVNKQH